MSDEEDVDIDLPLYAENIFLPKRYKVFYGGRGSSKSYTIARALLTIGTKEKIRSLCAREFQNSITESVHKLLCDQIEVLKLSGFYDITNNSIIGKNGSEFIFKGVRHNINSIKSMVGITHLWLEEAQTISKTSWDVLIPTIREKGSEIWVSFNPDKEDDPTYKMFIDKNGNPLDRDDALIIKVNWQDNPWFPDVLELEKNHLYRVNPDLADHVWGGACRSHSDAQIFKNKWEVRYFEPESHWDGPYFGADWGFSVDPTVLVKLYIDQVKREILIRVAKFGHHIELDDIPDMFDRVNEARGYKIRADCARPETISYVSRSGFDIEAAEKWTGSVEDGIEWLKSFDRIVIHPENTEMITEAKNYSYKVDRLTQDVLTDIVDAYNHGWDGIRYACQPMITAGNLSCFDIL